jgi:adenylate cyclase
LSVHLNQVSPERQLWVKSYDRSIRDVLKLEDDIARAVADEIQIKLTPQEKTRLASARPVNPEAHDAFLRGEFFAHRGTERDEETGIAYYREAIEKDRGYAQAYAGLANALLAPTQSEMKAEILRAPDNPA